MLKNSQTQAVRKAINRDACKHYRMIGKAHHAASYIQHFVQLPSTKRGTLRGCVLHLDCRMDRVYWRQRHWQEHDGAACCRNPALAAGECVTLAEIPDR